MLANYGLDPADIAQKLNISYGEVDMILQVHRADDFSGSSSSL
jgi:hypothetical protein